MRLTTKPKRNPSRTSGGGGRLGQGLQKGQVPIIISYKWFSLNHLITALSLSSFDGGTRANLHKLEKLISDYEWILHLIDSTAQTLPPAVAFPRMAPANGPYLALVMRLPHRIFYHCVPPLRGRRRGL